MATAAVSLSSGRKNAGSWYATAAMPACSEVRDGAKRPTGDYRRQDKAYYAWCHDNTARGSMGATSTARITQPVRPWYSNLLHRCDAGTAEELNLS